MPVESPELNTYLYLHLTSLAEIARQLKRFDEAADLESRAEMLVSKIISHFWDTDTGYFWAQRNHKPIKVLTPFNLYPLWTGALPVEIRKRLLDHLTNTEEFWGTLMLPTVARNDPKFDPRTMWRGPVWININYFFIEALQINNEAELANQLRENTLKMIMGQAGICEYYDAETGIPPAKAMNPFGWSAALFIDLAIQASRGGKNSK
jgi:glycogen debranching enzyme